VEVHHQGEAPEVEWEVLPEEVVAESGVVEALVEFLRGHSSRDEDRSGITLAVGVDRGEQEMAMSFKVGVVAAVTGLLEVEYSNPRVLHSKIGAAKIGVLRIEQEAEDSVVVASVVIHGSKFQTKVSARVGILLGVEVAVLAEVHGKGMVVRHTAATVAPEAGDNNQKIQAEQEYLYSDLIMLHCPW
jgi:hypothetical protein